MADLPYEIFDQPAVYGEFTVSGQRVIAGVFDTQVVAVDTTPPVVALIEPADGGELDRFAAVVLEVTDETALGRVFVVARYPTLGVEEVVHQGDRFAALYTGASSRASIAGGYRYSVRRNGGWPAPPVLTVYAPNAAVEV